VELTWHGLRHGSGLDTDADEWLVVGLDLIIVVGNMLDIIVKGWKNQGIVGNHLEELTASMHPLPNILHLPAAPL
jgi:hypothetical protein